MKNIQVIFRIREVGGIYELTMQIPWMDTDAMEYTSNHAGLLEDNEKKKGSLPVRSSAVPQISETCVYVWGNSDNERNLRETYGNASFRTRNLALINHHLSRTLKSLLIWDSFITKKLRKEIEERESFFEDIVSQMRIPFDTKHQGKLVTFLN